MQSSENGIMFAFFRSLAALNRELSPDIAYFVTEGKPVQRLEWLAEYKGTRKHEKDENFARQRREIIRIATELLPVVVANHPHHECDDVIAHLVEEHSNLGHDVTVVSTDTDFLQLANKISGYKQYDPIRKNYKELPVHDYIAWKALVGDSSDNITGFKGIGNKRALSMLEHHEKMQKFLSADGNREKFELNKKLISFISISSDDNVITFSNAAPNWDKLHKHFTQLGFKTIVSERGWNNFIAAFGG
jgi:5'-3' exonuclease